MGTTQGLLKDAERAAREAETWADLSNALFDPEDGLVALAYPTRGAREAYVQTDEYRAIRRLVTEAMQRHGLAEARPPRRATASSSGSLGRSTRRWSARRSPRGSA